MAATTVLYALAGELRAAQEARAEAAAPRRRARPNAFALRAEKEHVREGRGGAIWLTAQALLDGFPLAVSRAEEDRELRFFVRQPVPGVNGRHMWLLVQSPYEQLVVRDNVLQVQVAHADEHPCLAADEDLDVWWIDGDEAASASTKSPAATRARAERESAASEAPASQRGGANNIPSKAALSEAAAKAATKLSDRLSNMNVQDTFQKTSQGVASNLGKFASWAKKGIAAASDAIQNADTVQFPSRAVDVRKKIADGGFSEVFLAQDQQSGENLALKRCLAQTRDDVNALKLEIAVHKRTQSAYVMQLIDAMDEDSRRVPGSREFFLLFPLYSGGSLFDQMERALQEPGAPWPFPEPVAARIMAGVLEGLAALHAAGFAHRDIKPHNVLLDVRGGGGVTLPADAASVQPVLMDLGSCGPLRTSVATRNEARLAVDEATVKCSAPYRAPELFEVPDLPYEFGPALDVWSIGTTLFAMTYGRMWSPFEHPTQGVQTLAILQANVRYPSSTKNLYSESFHKVVKHSLRLEAARRPSVDAMRKQLAKLAAA